MLPTDVGSLLAGPEFSSLWAGLRSDLLDELARGELEQAERLVGSLEERLLAFSGCVELELHIEPKPHPGGRAVYDAGGHVALRPGGETDVDALGEEIGALLLCASRDRPREVEARGGFACRALGRPDGGGLSLPVRYRDGLVSFFGTRIDEDIERGFERLERSWPELVARQRESPPSELVAVAFDLRQVASMVRAEVRDPDGAALFERLFGLGSWDRAHVTIGTSGPHLQLEVAADFLPGDRGLIGAFLPDIDTVPGLLASAPSGDDGEARAFACGHVRWRALYDVLCDFAANFVFFGERRTVEQVKADANAEVGFDVEKDFLAHVSTEVLVLAELAAPDEPREGAAPDADGLCFVFPVTDDRQFSVALGKLLETGRLRPGTSSVHSGTEIVPIRFLDRGEYVAHAPGALLYAIGERGLAALKARLDAGAAPSGEPPESLRRAQRAVPAGWNLAAAIPLRILGDPLAEDALWELWKEVRSDLPGGRVVGRRELSVAAARFARTVASYGLDDLVILGGFELGARGSRARLRLVW